MKHLMYRREYHIYDHFKFLFELDTAVTSGPGIYLANWVETRVGSKNNAGYPIGISEGYPLEVNSRRWDILPISQTEVDHNSISSHIIHLSTPKTTNISLIRGALDYSKFGRLMLNFEIRAKDGLHFIYEFPDVNIPVGTKWLCLLINHNLTVELTPELLGAPFVNS